MERKILKKKWERKEKIFNHLRKVIKVWEKGKEERE